MQRSSTNEKETGLVEFQQFLPLTALGIENDRDIWDVMKSHQSAASKSQSHNEEEKYRFLGYCEGVPNESMS